jgi:predicted  nucleic acid-binding Zn-ribbon protein
MSLRTFVKKALPWLAFALAIVALGYTWNWALAKASARHRMHHAFSTGTTKYILGLCPSTPLVDDMPLWASDMRARCQVNQPNWGSVDQGAPPELDLENSSTWESIQLLSRLLLEISPGKLVSLVSLVVISLAGVLGLQRRGWLGRQGLTLRVARGAALSMLAVVMFALSISLVLLDEQETLTMCQITGSTYANLLSIDARCSQQTTLLRDTQALLEQKKDELDARARELEDLKQEIASLGVMRDALGSFKTELKSQSESTQQLIMAVTGATLEGITKAVDPLQKDVKGLDASLKTDLTDFKNGLRGELQGDLKTLVRSELKAALKDEGLEDLIRREVRAAVREDVRAVVRGELQDSLKTVVAASHVSAPAPKQAEPPAPRKPPEPSPKATKNTSYSVPAKAAAPETKKPTTPAQGKR